MNPLDVAAFWSRVEVSEPCQCWNWRGNLPNGPGGYGRFRGQGSHRIAYELVNGTVADDLVIRHRCDNRRCCNPAHLLPGTPADNSHDAVERARTARGERHGNTKLSAREVQMILRSSETLAALADRYHVSKSTVSYIKSGRSWKYVA